MRLPLKTSSRTFRCIWIYTGFDYEEIKNTQLAQMADYIVDGKFEQDKLVTGKMYGSSNQRIIKVKEELDFKSLIIYISRKEKLTLL